MYAQMFNQDIGNWNVANVTNMERMFMNANVFNKDIGNWNVELVTNMSRMFDGAAAFNQPIGNWNVELVTNMYNMFQGASAFNQPIGNWNVGSVTDMSRMFHGATEFNQDIGEWDVGSVTNMNGMFQDADAFNQDIGNWNIGNVINMRGMFIGATVFRQDLSGWVLSPDIVRHFNNMPVRWFNANYNAEHMPLFLGPPPDQPMPIQTTNIHSRFDRFVAQHGTAYLTILDRDTDPLPDAYYATYAINSELRTRFHAHINDVTRMVGDTLEQREMYVERVNMLMDKIAESDYEFPHPSDLMKMIAIKSVEYALGQPRVPEVGSSQEQTPSFADEYVKVFINESMESYSSGRVDGGNISCVSGIIERLTTSVGSAAMTMCIGKDHPDETCLPEYMHLHRLFSGLEINLNNITQAWAHMYDASRYANDMTADERNVFNDYFGPEDARTSKATRRQNYIDYVTGVVESQGEGFLTQEMVTKIEEEATKIDYVFDQADTEQGAREKPTS